MNNICNRLIKDIFAKYINEKYVNKYNRKYINIS